MFRTQPAVLIFLVLFATGHLPFSSVLADTVVLKNGKKIEGIVNNQNPAKVTINIGLGTVAFDRDQVASIERTGNEAIEESWQREYITRGKFVPEGFNDIAGKFSALESSRSDAVKAEDQNLRIQRQRTELFDEINAIQNEISELAARFQSFIPQNNVSQYNLLVKQQNRLATRAIQINDQLLKDNDQATTNRQIISAYLKQLADFKPELALKKSAAAGPNQKPDSKTLAFFSGIDTRIEKYSTEFQQIEVPHEGAQDHMLVKVRLNDRIDGLFLLDTGATYVTLSSELAGTLGLGLSEKNNVAVTLANGSSIAAQPVILDSMQTGDARVNGVIAMILPQSPHEGVDGLLGMSFLREFTIQLDPVNKKLVLQKFSPD